MTEYRNDVCPHGPFKLALVTYVTDGEGSIAEAKYDLPPGQVPTEAEVAMALRQVRQTLRENPVTADFRLMTRHEFMTRLMSEHLGYDCADSISVPGPNKFTLDSLLCDG